MSMLTVDAIDLHYGAAQALRRVSITAQAGQVTCVMGRNGVGKTMLMRPIVGEQPISGGKIGFRGEDISTRNEDRDAAAEAIAAAGEFFDPEAQLDDEVAPAPAAEEK